MCLIKNPSAPSLQMSEYRQSRKYLKSQVQLPRQKPVMGIGDSRP